MHSKEKMYVDREHSMKEVFAYLETILERIIDQFLHGLGYNSA